MPPKTQDARSKLDPVHDRLCGLAYMVVGESRFARATIKSALNGYGFRILIECESAEHALKIVRGGGIDAVVSEYDMPAMSGPEFVRRLRHLTDERVRRIPVVMIGNDAVAAHVQAAVDSGVNEFLSKPYSRRDLYFRLRRAVVSPRPFVVIADYAGPDRRAEDHGAPDGVDRRRRQAMSVQLYALAGSEPKWIKATKLGNDDARGIPNEPGKPASEPPAKTGTDIPSAPSFTVLAETDVSGARLAAAHGNPTGAEPKGKAGDRR
jgi:CheY-like chemotaxis protein